MNMEPSSTSAATTTSSSSLQGPRPAPLRVRKDSHKIRKPQQVREPVIIYTVSPKVVHADAAEFMSVVQRLTGPTPSSDPAAHHQIQASSFPFFSSGQSSSSSAALLLPPAPAPHFPFQLQHQHQQPGGPHDLTQQQQVISPAARLAAIEQATRSSVGGQLLPPFPMSILSPAGSSLPAIHPSFFSPPAGAGAGGGGINLFGELISPAAAFLGATAATQGGAAASHQNVQAEASPSSYYYWDLFNNQHHQN